MNRYFVFGDVHGEYYALAEALNEAGYDGTNPKHILVSLGDNFDRGPLSIDVYRLLTENARNICIKGNHETFLEEALEKGIDGEFVFFNSHAGVDPNTYPTLPDEHFMLWDIQYSHVPIRTFDKKTFVIGHHHASKVRENAEKAGYATTTPNIPWVGCIDENKPVKIGNKIAIDPCSNLTHRINILVIEDEPKETETKREETTEPENSIRITNNGDAVYTINYGQTNFTYRTNGIVDGPTITYGAYTNTDHEIFR